MMKFRGVKNLVLDIEYKTKKIEKIQENNIKATVINYEISEEDMLKLSTLQTPDYQIRRIILYKEWGDFELVIDNIQDGRIIQGGIIGGKFILRQYLVESGLNELLFTLSMQEGDYD